MSNASADLEAYKRSRSMLRRVRESDLVVLFLLALWLAIVAIYVVPMFLLLPVALIPGGGSATYRRLTGWWDFYGRQACMAIPFSWCGLTVQMHNAAFFMAFKERGNSLILANHCSRIDWLGAIYVGMCGRSPTNKPMQNSSSPRINFVSEVTTAFMPFIGWSRYLFGDILLQRAFHKDGPRILDNIKRFHDSGVQRCIFLAPEGTIADPGSASDEDYIANCHAFMDAMKKPRNKYLLTPRYKGMTTFVTHSPNAVAAATLAFVEGWPTIEPKTGAVVGGNLCTRALASPDRSIPDLFTIFTGGLTIFVNFQGLDVTNDADAVTTGGQSAVKMQLVEDQMRKDGDLAHFDEHRRYKGIRSGADWSELQSTGEGTTPLQSFLWLNFLQAALVVVEAQSLALLCGVGLARALVWFRNMVLVFFVVNSVTYKVGQWATDGKSRESLVGETAIKAVLAVLTGRSMNQGGKSGEEVPANGKGKKE